MERESARGVVEKILLDGENLRWAGQPLKGLILGPLQIVSMILGMPVLVVLSIGLVKAIEGGVTLIAGTFFASIIIMVIFGVYLFPFLMIYVRSRTYLAVTDRRAIKLRLAFGRKLCQRPLGPDTRVRVIGREAHGHATIHIGQRGELLAKQDSGRAWEWGMSWPLVFDPVNDTQALAELIRRQTRAVE